MRDRNGTEIKVGDRVRFADIEAVVLEVTGDCAMARNVEGGERWQIVQQVLHLSVEVVAPDEDDEDEDDF
jgi:hypothetical protein